MSGLSDESEASERRAWVRYPCDLGIACRPSIGGDDMRWSARILDISQGGIKLEVERRFEPGTILNVDIAGEVADAPSMLLVRVVHVIKHGGGRWMVGCRFARNLSERELQAILTGK